jgi:hypothetical protein
MNSKLTRIVISMLLVLIASGVAVPPAYAMPPFCYAYADTHWQDCHIDLVAGVPVKIAAKGETVTADLSSFPDSHSGPDGQITLCTMFDGVSACAMEYKPYGALIGKIGPTGEPFIIGSSLTFVPETSGRLYVIVNDNLPYYADNYGKYLVYQVLP